MSEKIVCVDLDGVLAEFDKWEGVEKFGPVIPGAHFFLEALRRVGFKIIIHTVRCSPDINPMPDSWEVEIPIAWQTIAPSPPGFTPPGVTDADASVWADYLVTLVRRWLNANALPFDEIWYGRGKPLADIYIDDRAVVCRPQYNPEAFKDAVLRAQGVAHLLEIGQ